MLNLVTLRMSDVVSTVLIHLIALNYTVFSMRVYVDNTNDCTLQIAHMPTERWRKYIEIRTKKSDFQLQQSSTIDNAISLNNCYWVTISFIFSEEFYLLILLPCTKCRGFETSGISVKDEKHSRLSGTCCRAKLVLMFGTGCCWTRRNRSSEQCRTKT
jgi:hypothetical protein